MNLEGIAGGATVVVGTVIVGAVGNGATFTFRCLAAILANSAFVMIGSHRP